MSFFRNFAGITGITDLYNLQWIAGEALFRKRSGNVVGVEHTKALFRGLLLDRLHRQVKRFAGFDRVVEISLHECLTLILDDAKLGVQ